MKLSEYSPLFFEVKKEGSFQTLGNFSSSPTQPSLSFVESKSYLSGICRDEMIRCVICSPELAEDEKLLSAGKGIAVSRNPRYSFYALHNWLAEHDQEYAGKRSDTVIGSGCRIHKTAIIAEQDVWIGDNVTIEEYAVIKPGAVIEDNAVIGTGSVIAGDSQIVTKDLEGNLFLVRQLGKSHIGRNVEIGYHTLIAKGTFPYDETRIGEYTKIESGVEIAHNSKIGKNVLITGQVQVCGNTVIGDGSRLNPKSIISNRRTIGKNVTAVIGSVVVNDVKDGMQVSGNFAVEHTKFLSWHRKKLSGK